MTMRTVSRILAGASAVLAVAMAAQAQTSGDSRISEVVQSVSRLLAAEQPVTAEGIGQALRAPEAATAAPAVVALRLDEAIALALDRNLEVAVKRHDPLIGDLDVAAARAAYSPTLAMGVSARSQTNPSASTIAGGSVGAPVELGRTDFGATIDQNVPWHGGVLTVTLNNYKQHTTNATHLFNPSYHTNWGVQYTQPLLRNFAIDATRHRLAETSLARESTDVELRAALANIAASVRHAYWELVGATEAIATTRQSLELAVRLVEDNQARVAIGTMAPLEVVQAEAEVANRRQTLVHAESARQSAELALKRLIVSGANDPHWRATVEPVDRPDFVTETIDIEAAVRRALSERTDVALAQKDVATTAVTLEFLSEQTKPQADLVAYYGLNGLGGTQVIRSGTGIAGQGGEVLGRVPGGYWNSLSSLWSGNFPQWTLAVNMSYPLGASAQRAEVAKAKVQLSQLRAQLSQIELQIAADVTNAGLQVRNSAEAVRVAIAALELARRKLEAEQDKFDLGTSTNYLLIQAQRDLADAATARLRAVLQHRKALVEFERLQQTASQPASLTRLETGEAAPTRQPSAAGGGF